MKTAMILAAGRGERLKPVTNNIPKALCKVHDIPLIEYHVTNLARAGFDHLVINHAYLGGKIRQHLGNGSRWDININYSPEPPGGLETGGGIFNALPLLGQTPFLAVNADIFTDYDFSLAALSKNSLGHLVLVKNPPHNPQGDFGLVDNHQLTNQNRQYTFAGIAYYRPELFKQHQPGRYSITSLLWQLVEAGSLTGEVYSGKWYDIGSPERLRLANGS